MVVRRIWMCALAPLALYAMEEPEPKSVLQAGVAALEQGRYKVARAALAESYEAVRTLDPRDPRRCSAAFALASVSHQQGDIALAERLYSEATCEQSTTVPAALAWNGLAEVYLDAARIEDAEAAALKAVRILEAADPNNRVTFVARRHVAEIRMIRGDDPAAETMLQDVAAGERAIHSKLSLSATLADLGRLYTRHNRFKEAEAVLREGMNVAREVGEAHPIFADSMTSLADVYRVERRCDRAEPLLRKALKIYSDAGDPKSGHVYSELGGCALLERKYGTARRYFDSALAVSRRVFGPEHVITALMEADLATALLALHETTQAEPLVEHALAITTQALGAANHETTRIAALERTARE